MLAGMGTDSSPVIEVGTGNAMIAGADFDTHSYRAGFDIAIPIFSPLLETMQSVSENKIRPHLVVSSQLGVDSFYMDELQQLQLINSRSILLLDECNDHNYTIRCDIQSQQTYRYPEVLQDSVFCLIFRGERMGQFALLEAMASSCIPVIVIDSVVMPFENIIDWKRAAIFVLEDYLNTLMDVLSGISQNRIIQMRKQVKFLYDKYFSSLKSIVETSLDIIQDRVFPQWGRMYDDWNVRPDEVKL